ncbi:hypothetical protein ACELLULO517_02430 [Acidisoma cellulosilytica]|uniref:Lipoprotein n=1 Tax=Acidisoma cellulosilyticum TaxID=2802395 RepID=A0A964E200_9PROT|nr:hypothetical protein [Acidisoma cellulosilyticum]MCB8879075.1 hypothetical protein [Acidisoma cellulosilyticum]
MKSFLALGAAALLVVSCAPPGRGLLAAKPPKPNAATIAVTQDQTGLVPLVTIPAGTSAADYLSVLTGAVQDAESRKPDVAFDVVSTVPQTGTPLTQITDAKALTPQAAEVASAVQGAGVPASRVTLGALVAAGAPGEQIRVYVR